MNNEALNINSLTASGIQVVLNGSSTQGYIFIPVDGVVREMPYRITWTYDNTKGVCLRRFDCFVDFGGTHIRVKSCFGTEIFEWVKSFTTAYHAVMGPIEFEWNWESYGVQPVEV